MRKNLLALLLISNLAIGGEAQILDSHQECLGGAKECNSQTHWTTRPMFPGENISGNTSSHVYPGNGYINQNIRTESYHTFHVCNDTAISVYIQTDTKLLDAMNYGTERVDHVLVPPHACNDGTTNIYYSASYNAATKYWVEATANADSSLQSRDASQISVYHG